MKSIAYFLAIPICLAGEPAVRNVVNDRFLPASASGQTIGGIAGERMRINLERRLLVQLGEAALLEPFQNRNNKSRYAGEHIGKFIDSASNAWQTSRDERLKAKLDRVVNGLIATQLGDGYLGTYSQDGRWISWDVWAHKYNLVGLLSYYEATGYAPALDASRKIGNLLSEVFGDRPGQRDIVKAGEHMGTAATSILEPVCELYRQTGDKRYLEFARYIVRSYDQPHGPKIVQSLLSTGSLYNTASAKSYEILSNLVGLVDLYRLTGDENLLKPVLAAWDDVTRRRMYISGTVSAGEHFLDDYDLPAGGPAHAGEGCATFSWLQMNWHLLRLTGEPKYADEIERTVFNHLLGAQNPRDGGICYYMPLDGRKPFNRAITCCGSSVPRGIAMIPRLAWGSFDKGVLVALYMPGSAEVLVEGKRVKLGSETRFPADGAFALTVSPKSAARFPVYLRVPYWTASYTASVAGKRYTGRPGQLLCIDRRWKTGDRVQIRMDMTTRLLPGGQTYPGDVAVQRGPQVLSLEPELNRDIPLTLAALKGTELADAAKDLPSEWAGRQAYAVEGVFCTGRPGGEAIHQPHKLILVPFMDAARMRTWVRKPEALPSGRLPLSAFAKESASREGDGDGSITDLRPDTYRRTFNWEKPEEDWYAVEFSEPVTIGRIVYAHGNSDFRGGWFDTSAGKPRIEVRQSPGAGWTEVARLDSYPATNAAQMPGITAGQVFEQRLPTPVRAVGMRIVGKPSSGRKGGQAYSSCGELAAYED